MALITWDSSYSVNVSEIDKQHKKLIDYINELNDAMAKGQGRDVLDKILGNLVSYTETHFAWEEKHFDQYKYADTIAHKKAHAELVKKVLEYQASFKKGSLTISLEVMRFLKDWLLQHIQGTDKKYTSFFHEHGIK